MRVALTDQDKPGALQIRLDNRAAHLDYIKATGVVEMAGPFLDDDGQMCGSLIVLEVETWPRRRTGPRTTPTPRLVCCRGPDAGMEEGDWLMAYWLFKSEPNIWGWDHQVAKGDAGEEWDGVRNYQARNNMRDMKIGDLGFFYHSRTGRGSSASSRSVRGPSRSAPPTTPAGTASISGPCGPSPARSPSRPSRRIRPWPRWCWSRTRACRCSR